MQDTSTSGRTVLVGVSGGIAAYKVADLVSRLRKAGHSIHVAMTEAAQHFVSPLTFAAVAGNPVLTAQFPAAAASREEMYPHLYPATRADVFVVAPATADMIGKLAHGLGADVVSTSALSLPHACLRVVCPAMNVEMWNQPVVQRNMRTLEQAGWMRIGPESGELACGMEGIGRMTEPEQIASAIASALRSRAALSGKRVLIISGPTREHLDPVRFIGNPSTGKMGRALAEEALAQGAEVDFVTGPVSESNLPAGRGLRTHRVISADDMLKCSQELYGGADIIVYAAAVADYKPVEFRNEKMPKHDGPLTVQLQATPDVAATLNARKRAGQVAIGFALQTHDGLKHAKAKLEKKRLDGIILNSLEALGGEAGTYTFISAPNGHPGAIAEWGRLDKRDCARRILGEAAALLGIS